MNLTVYNQLHTIPMKPAYSPLIIPRTRDMLFVSIFISVLLMGQRMLNLDGDLPRHLVVGKYIQENGTIPITELFIYPYLGQPFVSHEWLTDVIFHILYSRWKLAGIIVFSALLLSSTFTLLYDSVSRKLRLYLPVLLLVVWGAGVTSVNWAARPHLVSMFLLVIWLLWAEELSHNKDFQIWRFPVLMLAWSNLHGEFIAGILVLVAYAVGWLMDYIFDRPSTNLEIGKKTWLALILSTLVSLINPSGVGPWTTILGFLNNQYLKSRIAETHAPSFQNADLRIFFGLLIFSIFLLAIKKGRISTGNALLLTGFSFMGIVAIRNAHLFGIVAPFVLSETLVGTKKFPLVSRLEMAIQMMEDRIKGIFWIVICSILLGTTAMTNDTLRDFYQFKEPFFPVRAVEWLKDNHQQGNMFNELNWGGYISLQLWPYQIPFIDSMSDTIGDVTRQYETVISLADGWEGIFKKYNISQAIIPPQSTLAEELIAQGWEVEYQDETAIILVIP